MSVLVEYIWLDARGECRSKTKVLPFVTVPDFKNPALECFPQWSFDGSSTGQSEGGTSDLILKPVRAVVSSVSGADYLALCEVLNQDGTPHVSNTRASLVATVTHVAAQEPLFGIEQEYTLLSFQKQKPCSLEEAFFKTPPPQGDFYCGVGLPNAFGRALPVEHARACLDSRLSFYGYNAEVAPGQWEFQIGTAGPLVVADDLTIARWLLARIAEDHQLAVSLHPKCLGEAFNGSGCHTNFSTKAMREPGGITAIHEAISRLEANHELHVANYGRGIELRLTGQHETCSYKEFRSGNTDRGASVRIPLEVAQQGCGYFEDRRPNSNSCPYTVLRLILQTCCL